MASWLQRGSNSYLLRYEDLVREPHKALERLLSYLEIDTGSGVVEAMTAGAIERSSHRTTPSAEASVGRWREELNDAQCRAFEKGFAEAFETFGYGATIS